MIDTTILRTLVADLLAKGTAYEKARDAGDTADSDAAKAQQALDSAKLAAASAKAGADSAFADLQASIDALEAAVHAPDPATP